ncbi:MAG TPA: hypothetical protein VK168_04985, partial [Saprospiraceae bacterium]|nr:hypothetical protein [Saprospiraceae bacterium]
MKRLLLSFTAIFFLIQFSVLQAAVTYKLTYNSSTQVYTVSFNSTVAYNGALARIAPSTQFTIVTPDPDGGGPGAFMVTNLTALTALNFGVSQLNSPAENPGKDYLFFAPSNAGTYVPFNIPANTDIDLFTFQASEPCAGTLELYDNINDPLNANPSINADNSFKVLGGGNVQLYTGNSSGPVPCPPCLLENITAITTDALCFGSSDGTGEIIAADGTPPYAYAWPPSAGNQNTQMVSNLSAGSYEVTVTDDAGCTGTVVVTIFEPSQLTASATLLLAVSCNGWADGSVSVTSGGGTAPHIYLWSNGSADQVLNGLVAGTYTVTVTDGNGCSQMASIVVTQPASALNVSAASTNVSCQGGNDGSATATAGGGTSPYSFLWSNGQATSIASGLSAGTFTVTVTDDNGCTSTASTTITAPAALTTTINSQINVLCFGAATGIATVSVAGGTPAYSYLWPASAGNQTTPTATGLSAGAYIITVTDGLGCTATASAIITQPATSVSVSVNGINVACGDSGNGSATAVPSGGVPGYTFLWDNGEMTQMIQNLSTGTYTVTVTDSNGCASSGTVLIGQNSGSVYYKLTLDPDGQTYRVSFNSSIAYAGAFSRITGSTQFTLVFPDPDGAGPGVVQLTNITSLTDLDFDYTQLNHPAQNPGKDYAFFAPINAASYSLFNIPANTDIELFTFQIEGGCTGSVSLFDNYEDPLNGDPNIASDNNFKTLGGGNSNLYCNNGTGDVACSTCQLSNITAITTDANCFGSADGTATIIAADGVPDYTYSWPLSAGNQTTQTVTNLTAGSYTVTITDGVGCTGTVGITIQQPTALTANANVLTDVLCFGASTGSVTVAYSGGTPGYDLLWSNGAADLIVEDLEAGTYTVTVTDGNGCTATAATTVLQPAQPLVATITTSVNASCAGGSDGSATVSVLGGTNPYSYLWSNGQITLMATGLSAGMYTVTVTDNNSCSSTTSISITQPTALNASIASQTNVQCFGAPTGSATISVSGGSPTYAFQWPPEAGGQTTATAINLTAGLYVATVSDANSCTQTVSVTITEPASAVGVMVSGVNVSCGGTDDGSASADPNGGIPGYSYEWSNGELTPEILNLTIGTYTVTITDANNCTVSATVVIGQNMGSVAYKLTLDPDGVTYRVSFNSSIGYTGAQSRITGSSQFTLVFPDPDGAGPAAIQLANLTNLTDLQFDFTQLNNPAENPAGDYVFFAPVNAGTYTLFDIPANTDIELFTFQIPDGCVGTIDLFHNNLDPLNNDPNVDADNNFKTLGGGNINLYCNNATGAVACSACLLSNITILPEHISCNGGSDGSATAIVADGVPQYSYEWSNGVTTESISNVAAGTYTVSITDGVGCTGTASVALTEPTILMATATQITAVSCFGGSNGSATAGQSGGTAGYTYLWSNGSADQVATGLSATTYTVTVTDANGCTASSIVTIDGPADAVAVSISGINVLCNGEATGAATATASGGTASYIYLWNTGDVTAMITGLHAGIYAVTVTDAAGCTDVDQIVISEPAELLVSVDNQVNVLCQGDATGAATAAASGGTVFYTYSWSDGQLAQTALNLASGTYTVTVTDGNNCTATASVTIIEPTLLVGQIIEIEDVSCTGMNDGSATVVATGGVTPYDYIWDNGQTTPQATGLTEGSHSVTITDANSCSILLSVNIGSNGVLSLTDPSDIGPVCPGSVVSDILLSASPNNPDIVYNWTGGTSVGLSDGNSTGLNPVIPGFIASGTVGMATVTLTASLGTCSAVQTFDITVDDTQDPVVTCPADITVGTDVDKCNAVVTYSIPTATDDCPGVVLTQSAGLASGSIFP